MPDSKKNAEGSSRRLQTSDEPIRLSTWRRDASIAFGSLIGVGLTWIVERTFDSSLGSWLPGMLSGCVDWFSSCHAVRVFTECTQGTACFAHVSCQFRDWLVSNSGP